MHSLQQKDIKYSIHVYVRRKKIWSITSSIIEITNRCGLDWDHSTVPVSVYIKEFPVVKNQFSLSSFSCSKWMVVPEYYTVCLHF